VFGECSHNARYAAVRLHPLRVSPTAAIFAGSLAAATSPIRPTTARAIIASAYATGRSGNAGNKDGAGDGGPKTGAEVGHAAGQAGDLTLLTFGKARLHNIDRWREHRTETESNEEQARRERPGGRGNSHDQEQDHDAGNGENESSKDECPLWPTLSEATADSEEANSPSVAAVKMTPV
jgi:hypothetical protein